MNINGAVVILGAGASKGALIKGDKTPPLDSDFLSTAERIFQGRRASGINRAMVSSWKNFKRQLNRAGLHFTEVKSWRLEQLSTYLEARTNLPSLQLYQGKPREYRDALDSLKNMVGHVLMATGGVEPCTLHEMLFRSIQPNAVISFNYDIIADQTLLKIKKLNWKIKNYRGARFARIVDAEGEAAYYEPIYSESMKGAIPLVKLHGSMHWENLNRGDGYRLSGVALPDAELNTFKVFEVPSVPYIIPPVAAKMEVKNGPLKEYWQSAVDWLYEADAWIIWGYSFPQTDTITQVLFRTALSRHRNAKKPVYVINPDYAVRQRVIDVCRKVEVKQYTSIERFLIELDALYVPKMYKN